MPQILRRTFSLPRFLRDEEDLVALVPPEWRAVVQTDPATLESLDILLVDEVTLTGLRLATERAAPRWERDQTTRPTLPKNM